MKFGNVLCPFSVETKGDRISVSLIERNGREYRLFDTHASRAAALAQLLTKAAKHCEQNPTDERSQVARTVGQKLGIL